MQKTYEKNREILKQKAEELHDLTVTTCKMCGDSYENNLIGATNFFILNGHRFKMTIDKA